MYAVGQNEYETQHRVIEFFTESLRYRCLGNRQDRADNSNIEEGLLTDWLERQGNDAKTISRTLYELRNAAAIDGGRTLYDANRDVYGLLRYGVGVLPNVGELTRTVRLIDWYNPVGERLRHCRGGDDRRAERRGGQTSSSMSMALRWAILELKRSTVSVSEGIRQSLDAQVAGVHPTVLLDGAAPNGGQRDRGAALRRNRDS